MPIIKQNLLVDGEPIDNDDLEMVITLDPSTGVQIDDLTADTISYRFVENVTVNKIHNVNLTFVYNKTHKLVVPLVLTQLPATMPVVVPKNINVNMFEEGTELPFNVTFENEVADDKVSNIVITPVDANIEVTGDKWWIVDGPTAGANLTAKYNFDVTIGEKVYPTEFIGTFVLAPWNGIYYWMAEHPTLLVAPENTQREFTCKPLYRGKPAADITDIITQTDTNFNIGAITRSPDNTTITVPYLGKVNTSLNKNFAYRRKGTTEDAIGRDRINNYVRTIIQGATTPIQYYSMDGVQSLEGFVGDVKPWSSQAWLARRGIHIPWDHPDLVGEVVEGSASRPHVISARIDHYTAEAPYFEITGTDFTAPNSNYHNFWMNDEPQYKTGNSDLWVTAKKSAITVTMPGVLTGALGDEITHPTEVKWNGAVSNNTKYVFTAPPTSGLEFVKATATTVTWRITKINDTLDPISSTPVITVARVGADTTSYVQQLSLLPTPYDLTVTDTPLDVKMWQSGSNTPFTLYCNKRKANVTPVNPVLIPVGVVQVGTAGVWQIKSEVAFEAHSQLAEFTFALPADQTRRTASGTFNIAAYDGNEYEVQIDVSNNVMFLPSVTTTSAGVTTVRLKKRGAYVSPTLDGFATDNAKISSAYVRSSAQSIDIQTTFKGAVNDHFSAVVGVRVKETGSTETHTGSFNVFVYATANRYNVAPITPNPVEGKFGDEIFIDVKMGFRGTLVDLKKDQLITLSGPGAELVEMVPDSVDTFGFKLRFKNSVPKDTALEQLNVTVTTDLDGYRDRTGTGTTRVRQLTTLLPLTLSADFVTAGTGDFDNPLTLKQSVIDPE